MAEETQNPVEAPAPAPGPEATAEVGVTEKEPPSAHEPEPEKGGPVEEEVVVESEEKSKVAEPEAVKITQTASFKEESNVVGELPEAQKKVLDELKQLIQEALAKHEFTAPPPPPPPPATEPEKTVEEAKEKEKPTEPEKPAEEAKEEEKPSEAEKSTEEKVDAPPGEGEKVEVKEEKKVIEEKVKEEKKDEAPQVEAVVVVEEVVEKVTAVDEDGAKTVEAIEETIVAVFSAPPAVEEPAPAKDETATAAAEEEPKQEETPATTSPPPPPLPEEVFIWGIPLLGNERSDVILLKFLRARDFKVKDAFTMIKNTVKWRKEFGIEALLEQDFGNEYEKVVFMHGVDKENHPVCYNVYGAFQDKEIYQNCLADEEKRKKFLQWRIQFLEKSIRNKLDFSPTGICSIVQVNDFKHSPGPTKKELRQATNQAVNLLQDNYPEFLYKQVFINVPWWYLAFNRMISPFLTQRTKSKFVFAGPSKSAEALFKYIAPEQVPVQFGGLCREGEQEFGVTDSVTDVTIKPASKHTVEFPVSEMCTLVWELRVVGWDISYGAEFVPTAEDSYTVIVSKRRKVSSADEPVICDSFKIGEPGKVVLTIDNQTSKKKKLLYRSKSKPVPE